MKGNEKGNETSTCEQIDKLGSGMWLKVSNQSDHPVEGVI